MILSPTQPRLQHQRKDDCTIDFSQKMPALFVLRRGVQDIFYALRLSFESFIKIAFYLTLTSEPRLQKLLKILSRKLKMVQAL